MGMDRWLDAMQDRKEKVKMLRMLRHLFTDPDKYARFLVDLGTTCTMSEGRRLFYQLGARDESTNRVN